MPAERSRRSSSGASLAAAGALALAAGLLAFAPGAARAGDTAPLAREALALALPEAILAPLPWRLAKPPAGEPPSLRLPFGIELDLGIGLGAEVAPFAGSAGLLEPEHPLHGLRHGPLEALGLGLGIAWSLRF
jgi:hypothetical protein